MPKLEPQSARNRRAPSACDLCGLPLGAGACEARYGEVTYAFCCAGCRQVFAILVQAAGAPDPAAFRATELYRQCQASGIIPRSAADLASVPAAAPVPPVDEPAAGLKLVLKIANMSCPACAWLIEAALGRTPGVAYAACSFATDHLEVRYDPTATSPDRIKAAVARYGYAAASPDEDAAQGARRREWIRFGVCAFLTMNVMMLAAALYFGFFTDLPPEAVASLSWPMAAMAAGVLAVGGGPLFRRAAAGAAAGAFGMEALIAAGSAGAFALSLVHLARGSIHLYFDTASMLITLALLGRLLERRAKERVLESLQGFLSLMPAKVRIVSEAWPEGRFAAAGTLSPGDLFRVQSGEVVAADGIVLSGGGAIDESSVTGEPTPLARRPGDPIRSGSRVLEGEFTVCAERVAEDSTLGQMAAVVEATLARRPAEEPWTERLLRRVVPVVFALAAAGGAAAAFAGGSAEAAVLRAVTVVVVTCPCALGIAIPLARTAAVALAARRGMIVRRFAALERAPQIDAIVLDKTGTVTRGEWTLLEIQPLDGFSAEKALALAAGLEQGVDHPVARLLAAEARERHIRPDRVALIQPEPNGVIGLWEGLEVRIGSAEFLAEEFAGLRLPAPPGRSQVYLGAGGRPAAVFVFGDELRPTSAEAVAALERRGYGLALVSGDGAETTRAVAGRLGIPLCHGGLLPSEKAEVVAELQRRGKRVAMAGDGVNDAPALAQADLSLAVFGGGSLGREVADATLMRADPAQIVDFFDFARAVNRTIRQNLGLAFGYNAVAIPLAMSGLVSPLVAAVAMLASSLSVIGNTLRLVRRFTPRR